MIPLAVPNISGNEHKYLNECVDTAFVSSVGAFVTRMEEMVARAAGSAFAVATSSGTTGLHLALTCVGVGRDDLVILPSYTFIASANAIAHCGAEPWILDIDERSWTLDPVLLARCLSRETRRERHGLVHSATGRRVAAIMPVHMLGVPADMAPIRELAGEFELPIVADGAAALGARYRDHPIGGLADLSVFSFNGNKTVTAGGGGMIAGNDETLLELARHLSTTARVGTDYHHDRVGFNYRMTNLQAAVGCAQMERLDEFVAAKQRISGVYREALNGIDGVGFFPEPEWAESAAWFSGITVADSAKPDVPKLCELLQAKGIGARTFWKPIHLQPPYAGAPRTPMPFSEEVWKTVLTLPCSTNLSAADQATVVNALQSILV